MGIFKDKAIQQEFDTKGFVCLPALNAEQIEEITRLYSEVKPKSNPGIYSNVQDQPKELNRKIADTIKGAFSEFIATHFQEVQIAGCSYLVKQSGEGSQSEMHQDYTLVEEDKFTSLSIWCPMCDVDENNGCLQVINGSHKWFSALRSVNIPSLYLGFEEQLTRHLTPVAVKAGTAVLYAHNLFHGSKPNLSSEIRISSTISIAPKQAKLSHFFKQKDHILQVEIDEDFYYTTMPIYRSEGRLVDIKPIQKLPLTLVNEVSNEKFYETAKVEHKTSSDLLGYLKRLFGK